MGKPYKQAKLACKNNSLEDKNKKMPVIIFLNG